MNICLIGYGKMGKAIEPILSSRGHRISGIITSQNKSELSDILKASDIAIEFTTPEHAPDHILACLKLGVPVVSGSTGWLASWDKISEMVHQTNGSFLWASNFSVGVNIMFALNKMLAKTIASFDMYRPEIRETHHTEKKDQPSGTAVSLVSDILEEQKFRKSWILNPQEPSEQHVSVLAFREAGVVGYHEVRYTGPNDQITLIHEAFNRNGFAEGAVLAAEWLPGKKGIFSMKDVLNIPH